MEAPAHHQGDEGDVWASELSCDDENKLEPAVGKVLAPRELIFPEVDYDNILNVKGMNITINTTAKNDGKALELFEQFGFPFKQN